MKLLKMILLLLIFSPHVLHAREEILVATDEWPPFRIAAGDMLFVGLDMDLLEALEAKTGFKFTVKRYPWARAMSHMRHGLVDMMTGLAKTQERQGFIDYVDTSYYSCSTAFYTQANLPKKVLKYDDLYFYEIGYVRDSFYFEPFNSDQELNKHGANTEDQLLRMAQRYHLDIFIGTDCQVDYELVKRKMTGQIKKALYQPGNSVDLYLGFSKKSLHIDKRKRIDGAIAELKREGWFDKAKDKYFKAKP